MDGFTAGTVVLIILAILVIVILAKGIRIIQQSEVMIIERLGRYHKTLHSGINVIIPIIDQPRSILWRYAQEIPGAGVVVRHVSKDRIDLRETVYDFPKQNVITRDNIVTEINALIYFQIMDPVRSVYEISNLPQAIEKLTQTSLRNVIGDLDLDQTLTSRDTINSRLREILDEDLADSEIAFPPEEVEAKEKVFTALSDEVNNELDVKWSEMKSYNEGGSGYLFLLLLTAMVALACFNIWRKVRRRSRNMY